MRMSHKQPTNPLLARAHFSILALILLAVGGPAAAEQSSPLDVVLVMDSSGSMKKTDPQELRKSAAKLLVSLLGEQDRASVVSFSDQGYPVAYLTPVKGKQNETTLFAAVDKISNKGVYTNLLGGVQAAMRVIKRNPLPNHKPIIVLMTDGKMDLGDSAKSQTNSDRLLNDVVPQLKSQNIELHTVAFTDQSDKSYLEKLATATGGKFNLAQNDKQLHDVYTSIFEQNKQPNMLPFDGEKFTIDNAVKEVTIVGAKESDDVVLSLISPGGDFITAENKPGSMRWFTAQDFDLITIQTPKPGVWRLKSSTGKNKAYIITDLKFQLEVEPQEVAIGEGLMITAWLENKGKTIDKPSILSNMAMELRVYTPDGQTHVLDMQPQTKNDNSTELSGVYLNHIALPTDGRYQIEVIAKGSTFSRVRNSLVKVYDPNANKQTDTGAKGQPHPATVEPPAIAPMEAIKPPIESAADAHTNVQTPVQQTQASVKTQPPSHDNTHEEHKDAAHKPTVEEPVADQSHEKPAAEHTEAPEAAKPSAKAPVKAEKPHDAEASMNAEHQGPDLMKALVFFLIINGLFAALGGAAYFAYRWKKKKAAGVASEEPEEQDDERKAA